MESVSLAVGSVTFSFKCRAQLTPLESEGSLRLCFVSALLSERRFLQRSMPHDSLHSPVSLVKAEGDSAMMRFEFQCFERCRRMKFMTPWSHHHWSCYKKCSVGETLDPAFCNTFQNHSDFFFCRSQSSSSIFCRCFVVLLSFLSLFAPIASFASWSPFFPISSLVSFFLVSSFGFFLFLFLLLLTHLVCPWVSRFSFTLQSSRQFVDYQHCGQTCGAAEPGPKCFLPQNIVFRLRVQLPVSQPFWSPLDSVLNFPLIFPFISLLVTPWSAPSSPS